MALRITAPVRPEMLAKAERDGLPDLATLRAMTPAEAYQWVQDHVTDLASAKRVLSLLAALAIYELREEA